MTCSAAQELFGTTDYGVQYPVGVGAPAQLACTNLADQLNGQYSSVYGFAVTSSQVSASSCGIYNAAGGFVDSYGLHSVCVPVGFGSSGSGSNGAGSDTSVICSGSCTVTHVISNEITTPFFALDASGGALIAGAILAVWAVGYGFRLVIRALSIDGNNQTESES